MLYKGDEVKIAVITPTYNRIDGLEKAIASINAQVFKEWRHIIVNDGCPATKKYLKKFAKKDPACKSGQRVIINLEQNSNDLGVTPLNKGIEAATEPYFCVLADDNLYLPHHLSTLYQLIDGFKNIYDFVWGNTILKHKNIPELYLIRSSNKANWNQIDLGEPLYKRELWEKHGPYKYEDDPESGETKAGKPGCKYSYDWHFIRKCLSGGAKGYHINGNPSFVFYMDNKHLDPDKFGHNRLMIGVWPAGDGGCAHYRLKFPLNNIHVRGLADVKYWDKNQNWKSTDIMMLNSDVLVFQGPGSNSIARRMAELKKQGKICIVEVDDNAFAIDKDNTRYVDMGISETKFVFNSKDACIEAMEKYKVALMAEKMQYKYIDEQIEKVKRSDATEFSFQIHKDGANGFDIKRNCETLEKIGNCYRIADFLTCTTERLAEQLRLFNDNIYVLPNCVDLNVWRNDLPIQRNDDKTRIFWSGGSSHFIDLCKVKDQLYEVLDENPDCMFVSMGFNPEAILRNIASDQAEIHPWSDIREHPYRVHRATPDIGIIPLRNSDFADCKSPIKWIELAALGVPCVVSDTITYNTIVKHEENGLLFSTPEQFKEQLLRLVGDKRLRQRLGAEARKVAERYNITERYKEWLDLYEYMWLRKNFGNPTGNTLYPNMLKKWEDKAGRRIRTIKDLDGFWNSRQSASKTLPDETTASKAVQIIEV